MAAATAATCLVAAPPYDPLPAPVYSFDRDSPTIGTSVLEAGTVLRHTPAQATTALPADFLGFTHPLDELDALSGAHSFLSALDSFALIFSVDRNTVGTVDPDIVLSMLGAPFNAKDQAERGQAAGDQFYSTARFRLWHVDNVLQGLGVGNNVLTRNNFDEGGRDLHALPPTHAASPADQSVAQDRVDATAWITATEGPARLYFSASGDSPFLAEQDAPSGASIYVAGDGATGACLGADGMCSELGPIACLAAGGTWLGEVPCGAGLTTPMACCYPDGACADRPRALCNAEGGIYHDDSIGCAALACPIDGEDVCGAGGKPAVLTLVYTAGDCGASSNPQDGRMQCTDVGPLPETAWVVASEKGGSEPDGKIWFEGNVTLGQVFTVSAPGIGEDRLASDTRLWFYDAPGGVLLQDVRFHTSCSRSLRIGDHFGAARVLAFVDDDNRDDVGVCCLAGTTCIESTADGCAAFGGTFYGPGTSCAVSACSPGSIASCCDAGDKPAVLTLRYTAGTCADTNNPQDGKVHCDDYGALPESVYIVSSEDSDHDAPDGKVWFEGTVALGTTFDLVAALAGENKLKSDTFVFVYDTEGGDLLQQVKFHTSCSKPLAPGDRFGGVEVVDCIGEHALDESGACCLPDATCTVDTPDGCVARGGGFRGLGTVCQLTDCSVPSGCCASGDKPSVLTMQYTGADCSASSHAQNDAPECDDFETPPGLAYIVASESGGGDPGGKIWFEGWVAVGELFVVSAAYAGESELKGDTTIWVYDAPDGTLAQKNKFHTSCSRSLEPGDQFGAARLVVCCQGCTEAVALGPCCLPDDTCDLLEAAACAAAGGAWLGPAAECSACPERTDDVGTCCLGDANCQAFDPVLCAIAGGVWLGEGEDCASCSITATCCLPDGVCAEREPQDCITSGGTWHPGASCAVCDPVTPAIVSLYASAADLGLQPGDDIDAMVVVDRNDNGVFDADDRVLFSLTPGSPTLSDFEADAASVLVAIPGSEPQAFVASDGLGLGAGDDLDALEIFESPFGFAGALLHGVRGEEPEE